MVYSLDLRKRALEYLANGGKYVEASEIFGVTSRTLANWRLRQERNDLASKMRGSKPSKIQNEQLKKYVEEHPDKLLREIAEEFSSTALGSFLRL